MRRIAVLLVLLAEVVFFVDISIAGVKTIRGYAPGEFAVKGLIEIQAKTLVSDIKNDPTLKPNMDLQIFIEGFADKTGFSAENDRYAKERADGIAAILSREFPKAKIDFVSRGDEINRKEVTVRWKYVPILVAPIPEAKKQEKQYSSDALGISLVVLVLVLVGIAVVIIYYRTKDKIRKKSKWREWLDVVVNGEKYSVEVQFKYGKIISPFRSKSGFQITKNQNDLKGMVDSLKGCLKKDEFLDQKNKFILEGRINKL